MWNNVALPWLRKRFAESLGTVHEVSLRILSLGETKVQMLLEEEIKAMG